MKKVLLFIVFCFVSLLCFACNSANEKTGTKTPTPTSTGGAVIDDHKAEEVDDNIQTLIDTNGLFIKYEYHSESSDDEEDEDGVVAFGAKDNVFYISYGDEETYIDLSSDTAMVVYTKYDDEWEKNTTEYSQYFTKETAMEVSKSYALLVNSFMTMYQAYQSIGATKTSDTVAGRSCDKYTTTMAAYGVSATYSFSIDRETGACLKWEASGASTEGSGAVTFTCVEFKTNYTITLPEAKEASGYED